MDQDFGYEDLVDKKHKAPKTGGRKPLVLILVVVLVLILLGAGGYLVWSRPELLSFLSALRPAPAVAAEAATPTPEAVLPTETAAAPEAPAAPTETSLPPTEAPVAAAPEALLPLPEFGHLVQVRADGGDLEARAVELANNMAVREPFTWEYLEYEPGTLIRDVERYYIDVLNKDMGFLMSFNEQYPSSALAIFKFKQDGRRVTIEFFEGKPDQPPAAFLFYEGW